ncbi:MAG: nucleotide exchange factor GrpE [SAR202 cluster bacterium]|nr:nucleotide exchange factor GrpE [SAR202 cluster bacterium]
MGGEGPPGPEATPAVPAPQPAEAESEDGLKRLRQELEAFRVRADRLLANWQRSEADLANLRRRAESERSEMHLAAIAAVVGTLLPIVDDLERALGSVAEPLRTYTWVDGVWLTYRKFLAVLEAFEVRPMEADGVPFDPLHHQVVQETPGDPGKVLQVVQMGYLLKDKVLRPALVVVGKGPPAGTP